jgi:hypothetical protein
MRQAQWVSEWSPKDGIPSISFSRLSTAIKQSWQHFKHAQVEPELVGPAANFSRLFHELLLEKTIPENRFEEPQLNLRTKDGTADFEYWARCLPNDSLVVCRYHTVQWMIERLNRTDLTVVSADDFGRAEIMASKVRERPFWKALALALAEYEKAGEFTHAGVRVRFKADIVCKHLGIIADVKVVPDASPEAMARKAFEYLTDVQAGMYLHGANQIEGNAFKSFVILAVENAPPFAVQEYTIPAHVVQFGWDLARKKLEEFAFNSGMDVWPSYTDGAAVIELPWQNWMVYRREEATDEQGTN